MINFSLTKEDMLEYAELFSIETTETVDGDGEDDSASRAAV